MCYSLWYNVPTMLPAEVRAERWTGAYRSRRKKKSYIIHKYYIKYILSYFNCHIPVYLFHYYQFEAANYELHL